MHLAYTAHLITAALMNGRGAVLGNELLTAPDLKLNSRVILGKRLGYRLHPKQLSHGFCFSITILAHCAGATYTANLPPGSIRHQAYILSCSYLI